MIPTSLALELPDKGVELSLCLSGRFTRETPRADPWAWGKGQAMGLHVTGTLAIESTGNLGVQGSPRTAEAETELRPERG